MNSTVYSTQIENKKRPTPHLLLSYYHVLYTILFCCIAILTPLSYLNNFHLTQLFIVPMVFIVASFVEYIIHRFPMHRKYPGFEVMLKLHMIHHDYFDEHSYEINSFHDFSKIVFPPVVLNIVAFGICPIFTFVSWWALGQNCAILFFVSTIFYYFLMQIVHVLCHVDKNHWIADLPLIYYLWKHHQTHHTKKQMAKVNFNFIFPFADSVIGTNSQMKSKTKKTCFV